MTLPPLLRASATVCGRRYPAIVGLVKGSRREIFICGEHIDRFLRRLSATEFTTVGSVHIEAGGEKL